jgi:hypothetical protein
MLFISFGKVDKMKKITMLLLLLLVTGCSVNYKVNIKEDLTIVEEAEIKGNDAFYQPYYKTTKVNVLKELLENYKETLVENSYNYELLENYNPSIKIRKEYSDINTYLNSSLLFNDYFEKINYTKDDKIVKIETEGFNPNEEDNPDRFFVRDLDIAITCAYKVTNSNAVKINKKTNTYHFQMDEDTKDFKILLEFDTSSKFNPNIEIYVMILVGVLMVIASWIFVYKSKRKGD